MNTDLKPVIPVGEVSKQNVVTIRFLVVYNLWSIYMLSRYE